MSLKLITFYLLGFTVLYLEPIAIGGLTFGILWKLILIFVLFLPVIYTVIYNKEIEMFALLLIIFACKTLISYTSLEYPVNTLTTFIKALMLPILYLFFVNKVEKETLIFLAKHFSILIVFSFIPYMLGLLEPLGEGYDLSAYGLDTHGLIGPFINPHSASISLAFAMIIITSHIKRENSPLINLFYATILALGLYEMLQTYVRTGLAIYIITLLYFYLHNINFKKFLQLLFMVSILGGIGAYLYQTSEVVQMRVEDRNQYVESDVAGSGRFLFWEAAVDNWMNDDGSVILIGLGQEYAKDKMEKSVGLRIFAHNEFFQTLQQEGLIGFTIFILSLYSILRFIFRYKRFKQAQTALGIFIGMIIMMMFQGGFYFNIVLLLSIYLALLKKAYIQEEHGLEETNTINNRSQDAFEKEYKYAYNRA